MTNVSTIDLSSMQLEAKDLISMQTNLVDMDDMIKQKDNLSQGLAGRVGRFTGYTENQQTTGININGSATDTYVFPGSLLTPEDIKIYLSKCLSESYRLVGQGNPKNLLQNFLSRLDHHGTAIVPLNNMNSGYTFITRPRLNLTMGNLRSHPVMTTLESENPNSVSFMIRMLLDTRLCGGKKIYTGGAAPMDPETERIAYNVLQSGLIDPLNPFFTPLVNGLKGLSGFPDFTVQEETTEGDFHSGDFTYARGSDMNNRTQELSLEFRDVEGSIIMASIYYWLFVMALQAKGVMVAYPDDIYAQRLNYTVSIYRFITDQSRRRVLWWGKATGCFPKSIPVGAIFNIQQGETSITSAMNFSVPFVANDVKIQDPGILTDFNRLMDRYTGDPRLSGIGSSDWVQIEPSDPTNFNSLPYLEADDRGIRLVWKTHARYSDAWHTKQEEKSTWDELMEKIEKKRNEQYTYLMQKLNA